MTANESTAIKICRVTAIFFMTYVHVSPGFENWVGEIPAHMMVLGHLLSEHLGRASVPALSVLSGYLAMSAFQRRPSWWVYVKERWTTLITPLITWNLAIILLSIAILLITGVESFVIKNSPPSHLLTPHIIFDKITAYSNGSTTFALNFLRDIFVCSALLPIVYFLIKRFGTWCFLGGRAYCWVWTPCLSLIHLDVFCCRHLLFI